MDGTMKKGVDQDITYHPLSQHTRQCFNTFDVIALLPTQGAIPRVVLTTIILDSTQTRNEQSYNCVSTS
jgi:hypothetical protein